MVSLFTTVLARTTVEAPEIEHPLQPQLLLPWWPLLLIPLLYGVWRLWRWVTPRLVGWRLWRRRLTPAPPLPVPPLTLAKAKKAALEAIHRIAADAKVGTITVREAHRRLSAQVRSFAWQATGIDARAMTPDDLEQAGLGHIAEAVRGYYPMVFAPDEVGDLGNAAERAREVIQAWN